jgi:lipoprotein NlpD
MGLVGALFCCILGCSTDQKAPVRAVRFKVPVDNRTHPQVAHPVVDGVVHEAVHKETQKGIHIVKPGESLYTIAWRYGRDFRTLSAINHLDPAYTIYAGQRLKLGPSAGVKNTADALKPVLGGQKSKKKLDFQGRKDIVWHWPVRGPILKPFDSTGEQNKGIDIAVAKKSAILAAAPGRVVYSGSRLKGYGKLIIIKHTEVYLSAYANNDVLWVQEGQQVLAGQKIGEIAKYPQKQAYLHFEIRKRGVPVDPLKLL